MKKQVVNPDLQSHSDGNAQPKSNYHICGVDEAGKGPVLGPMVIAAVACSNQQELADLGVMDSKALSPKRRSELFALIKARFPYTVAIRTAADIDQLRTEMTMNEITARAHAEVVRNLECSEAYLDACDVNEERYGRTVGGYIGHPCTIISCHRADQKYPAVSAASIIAKVIRDRLVQEMEEEYGSIGSGYPADPVTIGFLTTYIQKYGHPPAIARTSWATVKKMMQKAGQQKLF
jgi:ribonuclease HII